MELIGLIISLISALGLAIMLGILVFEFNLFLGMAYVFSILFIVGLALMTI